VRCPQPKIQAADNPLGWYVTYTLGIVRKTNTIFVISLALVAFLPSFGAGSRANAGFVSVASQSSSSLQPNVGSNQLVTHFRSVNQHSNDSSEDFQTEFPSRPPIPTDGLPRPGKEFKDKIPAPQNNHGSSSTGTGFSQGPVGQQAGFFEIVKISNPATAELLRFEDDLLLPPPFGSPLFRPPRV
jgi:hypothetical protein